MQQYNSETEPYGIDLINALKVSDEFVNNKKVCIIDSGYDINHPDLPSGSTVTGAQDGGAGIWSKDGFGHGTHVAGTIAAMGHNGKGVMGVARNGELNIHIVRIFGDGGTWTWTSTFLKAVS
jgi:serine protease